MSEPTLDVDRLARALTAVADTELDTLSEYWDYYLAQTPDWENVLATLIAREYDHPSTSEPSEATEGS